MEKTVRTGKYTVKQYEISGFALIESIYPSNLRMPPHIHEAASFCFVLQGAYLEKYKQKSRLYKTSTVNLYPINH